VRPLLLLLVMACGAAASAPERVRLVVRNPAQGDQEAAPVTVGLPWPPGVLASPDALRLLDATGGERPLQAEALSRWPDGSVKWALLDLQATVRAGSATTLWLQPGAGRTAAPEPPLAVREDATGLAISTGAAAFRLSKTRFPLFEAVTLARQDRPLVAPHTEADGLSLETSERGGGPRLFLSSLGPATAEVETRGPLRVVVRVAGKLQAADGAVRCDYVARLHFYAGKPAARLQLTLLNRERDAMVVNDLTVRLPLRLRGLLRWELAGERGRPGALPGSLSHATDAATLLQRPAAGPSTSRFEVTQRGRQIGAGALAAGGVALHASDGAAAVAVRHFAAASPKALRVLGRPRIEVALLPREAATLPANGRPHAELGPGRALTHDLLFWFASGEPPALGALCAAFDAPLVAHAAAEDEPDATGRWYAASRALALAPLDRSDLEPLFAGDLQRLLAALDADGAWGVGRRGSPLWQPFDPTLALAREFLRRGDPRLLAAAHAGAQHLADAATFHNVAGGPAHMTGACYEPATASLSPQASWYAGAWLTFLLTGDRVLLDAALKNAASAARRADEPDATPLAAALAVINLLHAADLAPRLDPDNAAAYQTALDAHVQKLLSAPPPSSGPEAAIVLEALSATHTRRPDQRLAAAFIRAAEQAPTSPVPDGGTAPPSALRIPPSPISLAPLLPWLAAATEATGDSRFLAKARRLERRAAFTPCQTPLEFALRYRGGDLFAAAWARHAAAQPPPAAPTSPGPGPALGLQCRLESEADAALPDLGVGGCVIARPFVALPDGARACLVQAPGAPQRPDAGVWLPLLDAGNVAETQGAIECRLLYRKLPGDPGHTLAASGDLPAPEGLGRPGQHGFVMRLGPKGLELLSRSHGAPAVRLAAPDAQVKLNQWHHIALVWHRGAGLDLYLDGHKVAHSPDGRLGLGPWLRFPCDPADKATECLLRHVRLWRRPPPAFPAATDLDPPAAVTDLLLAPAEGGKMLLSWTAPRDPSTPAGGAGRASAQARRYDLRISSVPFDGPDALERWAEGDRIAAPTPSPPGSLEKLLIGPLPRGRGHYIALRAEDDAGNASPLSNIVHAASAKPVP